MTNAKEMLELAKRNARELAVPSMDVRPRRRLAILMCMDVRLEALALLGLERGDAHVIRNAGGLVTDDAIRSLAVSQRMLGTEEIVVIMHDRCGLLGASDEDFAQALAADGARPSWRLGAFSDVDAAVREGLARLRASPELVAREQISGFVLDPDSGLLRTPHVETR
jgi:carbonic anhydrase